jgi:hypothetical protein
MASFLRQIVQRAPAAGSRATPIEVRFQDEMRVGQKNKLTHLWARKSSRPHLTHDQRTRPTYLLGAVCPARGAGAGLVLPHRNAAAMQLRLDELLPLRQAVRVVDCLEDEIYIRLGRSVRAR